MQDILEEHKAQNFDVVTINVLANEEQGAVKIMSQYGFTALKNPGPGWSWATKNYGVEGTPTSYLVGPDGKIIFDLPGLESLESERLCDQEVTGLLKWVHVSNSTAATAKAER